MKHWRENNQEMKENFLMAKSFSLKRQELLGMKNTVNAIELIKHKY